MTPRKSSSTASATTATASKTADQLADRRAITLSIDEKLSFFTRLAASVDSGKGIPGFLLSEVELYDLLQKTKPDSRAFLLSGKPSQGREQLVRELAHLMLELGVAFAPASQHFPGVFDPYLVAVLNAAEKTGDYGPVLRRYVKNLIDRKNMRDTLINAMIYPALVLVVALIVIVLFMVVIVPGFSTIYEGLLGEAKFHWATQLVISTSDIMVGYWYLILAGVGAGVVAGWFGHQNVPQVKEFEHRAMLAIPVIGTLVAQVDAFNFLTTFTMLISAGGLLTESSELAADAIINSELRDAARKGSDHFTSGRTHSLAVAFASEHPVFSPASSFFNEMKTFEDTGRLEVLEKYADNLKYNADQTRDRLVKLIEPVSLFMLGGLVGFLVFALYMPMFELIGKLAR